MRRPLEWYGDIGRSSQLGGLMSEARRSRRARRRRSPPRPDAPDEVRRRYRAEMLIERMLSGPLPELVDCSSYLNRLATRRQVASRAIGIMMTSVESVTLNAVSARALAVAIADLLHFLETAASGLPVRVYLAIALDHHRLVVGLGAEGELRHVVTREAHRCLLRARSIVAALGGDFQRGVDGDRAVFGLTFPHSIAEWSS